MKQLLVLSGKGGTGKTTLSAALIALSGARAYADCDVDAPNLHLVTSGNEHPRTSDFLGFQKARIDPSRCTHCGLCERSCRFQAVHGFRVNTAECEGCAVCAEICPAHAITMTDCVSGDLMLHKNEARTFSTAQLRTGSGASGKLVTEVKKQLRDNSAEAALAIIDGSPGIGCPVIASISGVSLVLIVAEPTVSGIHDMRRIVETTRKFGTDCVVCINKHDINDQKSAEIEDYCRSSDIQIVGRIPFDPTVSTAVNNGRNIISYPESPAAHAITELWDVLGTRLTQGETP